MLHVTRCPRRSPKWPLVCAVIGQIRQNQAYNTEPQVCISSPLAAPSDRTQSAASDPKHWQLCQSVTHAVGSSLTPYLLSLSVWCEPGAVLLQGPSWDQSRCSLSPPWVHKHSASPGILWTVFSWSPFLQLLGSDGSFFSDPALRSKVEFSHGPWTDCCR